MQRPMGTQLLGMAIVCLSGIAGGSFAFPLRLKGSYAEENTLLGAYVLAICIIPLVLASVVLPFWPSVVAAASPREILVPLACGLGWGIGAIAYAQGVTRVGLALTVSTVMGLTLAIGATVPLVERGASVSPEARRWVLAGLSLCVAGVLVFGVAGRLRERRLPRAAGGSLVTGLLWCVLSGILSPLANIGFDAGAPLVERAIALGGNPRFSAMLGWFPTWSGGLLTFLAVLGTRLVRRRTWKLYFTRGSIKDMLSTVSMGSLHFLGQVPYGIGAYLLGVLGTSIGWGATLASQLLAANALGAIMGEWRGAPRSCGWLLAAGVLIVLAAVVLLAKASVLASA